jgi:glycosyltransferase involved in cell wall biosynthesis
VGVVARLAAVKRLDTLIAALARLPPDVHGVFIGDGPERAQLESQASGCGVSERTHFAGQVVNAGINLHGLFDVSALCSYSEGFPNSLLEAFGAARAVVATPVGGVRDIVADEVTGLLFAVGDSDALAQAIKRLHEDHALRARLGTAGRAIAEQRYRRKAVIERLQSFYRALARRDRPTGRQAE